MFVEQGSVHGQERVVAAVFDGTFAMAVDENGALLCLGVRDAADVDKGFDDIVERVNIVVVQHEVAT